MKHLYNFGFSQEDERSEARAFGPAGEGKVLAVASAGEMPLSLLALGAHEVVAVDVDEAQLHPAVHLSNVPDWIDDQAFWRLLGDLAAHARGELRVVWRLLHRDPPLPAWLAELVYPDAELGRELQAADRYPFYKIVPARIVGRST